MSSTATLIAAWARSPVAPFGGALSRLQPHEIAAPVLQAVLAKAGVPTGAVDAIVVGNALGAGGNPARMLALAAGLPESCAAFTLDTQCCAGLDAVSMAVGLLASGQASVALAGGVEAWSRAPIRLQRPYQSGEPAVEYERPPFAPDTERDPDLLMAAAQYALRHGWTRHQQDAYALRSHRNALRHQLALAEEIVPMMGLHTDSHPRNMSEARVARMPPVVRLPLLGWEASTPQHGSTNYDLTGLAISAKADGASFVLLATEAACRGLHIRPKARWVASASVGSDPRMPLIAAEHATRTLLKRSGLVGMTAIRVIELHDAFAVQGLSFCKGLEVDDARINRRGGGLARGHPIGASASVALVRVLSDLTRDEPSGALGIAAVAGAGGLGAAALIERLPDR